MLTFRKVSISFRISSGYLTFSSQKLCSVSLSHASPVLACDAALAVDLVAKSGSSPSSHSFFLRTVFSPQVCQPQADEAGLQSHYIPTAFLLAAPVFCKLFHYGA